MISPSGKCLRFSLFVAFLAWGGCATKNGPATAEPAPTRPGASFQKPLPHFYTQGVYKDGNPNLGTVFSDSHGGFGYVSTHSEKTADAAFLFACDAASVLKYQSQATGPNALQRLRDKLFTYLALRAAAMNPSLRPVPVHPPQAGCVSPGSPGINALQILPKHSPTDSEILGAADPLLFMEFRAVSSQLKPSSLVYALAFDDHLKAQEHTICADPAKEARCFDLRAIRARLEGDFELLFSRPEAEISGIRDRLVRMIGLVDGIHSFEVPSPTPAPSPSPEAVPLPVASDPAQVRGQEIYNFATQTYGANESFQEGLDRVFKTAGELSSGEPLRSAYKSLLSEAERIWKEYRSTLQVEVDGICTLSVFDILAKYPNVVRQAVVDSLPDTTLQAALCSEPGLDRNRRQESCVGVAGGPLPGSSSVTVHTSRPDYPFNSLNAFTLSRALETEPYVIHLQVPLQFDADFKDAERAEIITRWNAHANSWYNCQTGQSGEKTLSFNWRFWHPSYPAEQATINCPTDTQLKSPYALQFKIELMDATLEASPKDAVAVHRCYNADIRSHDCALVRAHQIERWCAKDGACAAQHPAAGDPMYNRADSSNFIAAQKLGTLVHELGHHLGLADEYADPSYPLNLLGDGFSIMNHSELPGSHLFTRQFGEMLRPLGCSKPVP